MSQPNLNEDLNIVANSNIEITLLDGDLNIIQALDDEPNDVGGLTSAELKAKFDEGPNKIKEYINGTLIPEILTEEATEAARAAAEAQRETNENQRIENENARIAAEQARVDETNGVVAQANNAAQSWAIGGTGTREGEDTNNAKYWSEQAAAAAGGGVTSFKGRTGSVIPASGDYTAEMVGAYSKEETDTLLQKKADASSVYSKEESISASTRTALSLPDTATPDAALSEIARQLSESGGISMDLLWENASPASTIAAQTISIDTSAYDRICVFCSNNVDYPNNEVFCIVRIGKIGTATIVSGGSSHIRSRQITNNGASGVYIDNAYQLTNMSTSEVNNTFVRPVAIYGMKLA